MTPLLLALLAGAAHAQDTDLAPDGQACATPTPRPIAGTSGLRASGEAIQQAAAAYSVGAFAGRYLLRDAELVDLDNGLLGSAAVELGSTYGAAHIPVYQPAAGQGPGEVGTCDAQYRVAARPLDIHVANTGFIVTNETFGAMVATSLVYAAPTTGDGTFRAASAAMAPPYALAVSAGAPAWDLIIPGDLNYMSDGGGFRLEWMAGLTADLGSIGATAAYTSSVGGYAHITEWFTGAYVFAAVARDTDPVFEAGFDRFHVPDTEAVGLTTARYQDIPFLVAGVDDLSEQAAAARERLRVGAIRQDNLFTVLDLAARYRIAPTPSVSELTLGLHTPGFHPSGEGEEDDYTEFGALIKGGYVTTPAVWSLGLAPRTLPSGRVAVQYRVDQAAFSLQSYINDPDQLQLYPSLQGAVSWMAVIDLGI